MHIADFCVTDTKSAIAVARALGREYIQSHLAGDSFGNWLAYFNSKEETAPTGASGHPRDQETGLWLLCICSDCDTLKEYLDAEQTKRRRKRNALAK